MDIGVENHKTKARVLKIKHQHRGLCPKKKTCPVQSRAGKASACEGLPCVLPGDRDQCEEVSQKTCPAIIQFKLRQLTSTSATRQVISAFWSQISAYLQGTYQCYFGVAKSTSGDKFALIKGQKGSLQCFWPQNSAFGAWKVHFLGPPAPLQACLYTQIASAV